MRELLDQIRIYRRKTAFLAPHRSARNLVRTEWEFLRRRAHVTWPLYGPVLLPLREGRLQIGRNTSILAGCWFSIPGQATLTIGRNCYVNLGVTIHAFGSIEIGDFTAIGSYSFISDSTHRIDDPGIPFLEQGMVPARPVVIGSNVWVGVGCAIMPGVHIGDGALVGAHSVVTRDVAAFTVVAGAPARVIREIRPGSGPGPAA
jgi:acetyltransferase-like isoleucine patch superfamily enzyme